LGSTRNDANACTGSKPLVNFWFFDSSSIDQFSTQVAAAARAQVAAVEQQHTRKLQQQLARKLQQLQLLLARKHANACQ
jgi:hypothetical protein